jgi:hypothetical protein
MKNLLIYSLVFFSFSCIAAGQKHPPAEVSKAFTGKFDAAKSVKWTNESTTEWEAEFIMNGKEMSASYDNAGKWLETETEISSKDLTAAVTSTLAKEFSGYKTGEMSILESPDMKGYEIALKKAGSSIEVIIDPTGRVIKKPGAVNPEK